MNQDNTQQNNPQSDDTILTGYTASHLLEHTGMGVGIGLIFEFLNCLDASPPAQDSTPQVGPKTNWKSLVSGNTKEPVLKPKKSSQVELMRRRGPRFG